MWSSIDTSLSMSATDRVAPQAAGGHEEKLLKHDQEADRPRRIADH
jgi:hypothetical protein